MMEGETFMLNQFQACLVQKGYKEFSISGNPSTAIDTRKFHYTIKCIVSQP